MPENLFSTDGEGAILRDLAPRLTARVFAGDQATDPIVQLQPGAEDTRHAHPQDGWTVSIASSTVRHRGTDAMAAGR